MSKTAMNGAAVTDPPPGYPKEADSRGRARKSVNGKLIELGKYGTPESIAKYYRLGLDKAHIEAIAAAAPFTGPLPPGYPENADARGDAIKRWDGKNHCFGKHGTQASVNYFNQSDVGRSIAKAYLAVIGEKTGPNEWTDPDGTKYWMSCDISLGSRTLTKYRLDMGIVPRLDLDEAEFREVIDAAKNSADHFEGLDGTARAMLYEIARVSSFTAGELAALCPKDFSLSGNEPKVRFSSAENEKPVVQPLPVSVAKSLRTFLAGRPADVPVWPGTWHERAADMLCMDLDGADIPYVRAKEVPIHDGFNWVYNVKDAEDLAAVFDMPEHLDLLELYSHVDIAIAESGSGYKVGDILTLQGGIATRPLQITVKRIDGADGGVMGFRATPGAYSEPPACPATASGGAGTGFAADVNFKKCQFGDLTVICVDEELSKEMKRRWWRAKCKHCRKEISVSAMALLSGKSKTCGGESCRTRWESAAIKKEHEEAAMRIVDDIEYWAPRVMAEFLRVTQTTLDLWSATETEENSEERKKRAGCPDLNYRAMRRRKLHTALNREISYFNAADGRLVRKAQDRSRGIPTPADATSFEEAMFELERSKQTLRRQMEAAGAHVEKPRGHGKDGRSRGFRFVPNWFIKQQKPVWEPAALPDAALENHTKTIIETVKGTGNEIKNELAAMKGAATSAPPPPTVYHHGERSYSIDGVTPQTVSPEEHYVLDAFAKAGKSLTTKELENACANVARVMGQLICKFPGAAMKNPGKGAGYFIRTQPVPTK